LAIRDVEFDIEEDRDRCLHDLTLSDADGLEPGDVIRVPHLFDKPSFFIDGATCSDIVQGASADCWFLSALATVSTIPGLIEKICVAVSVVFHDPVDAQLIQSLGKRDEKVGVYGFIFYRDAGWTDVIIDEYALRCSYRR
jgi:hypothetical protein